jgi:tetratricopeptide (TPR) repeat protein
MVVHGRAAEAARALGDQAAEAAALSSLSQIDLHHGHGRAAAGRLEQALGLFREVGDQVGEARALSGLGDVHLRLGRYRQAREHLRQGLTLCRETSDRLNEAYIVALLGDLSLRLGRDQDATERLTRALRYAAIVTPSPHRRLTRRSHDRGNQEGSPPGLAGTEAGLADAGGGDPAA